MHDSNRDIEIRIIIDGWLHQYEVKHSLMICSSPCKCCFGMFFWFDPVISCRLPKKRMAGTQKQNHPRNEKEDHASKLTIQGTNISPENGILQMIFLFPRWDMLVPWRVHLWVQHVRFRDCKHPLSQLKTQGIQTAAYSMVFVAKNLWETPRCFC